MVYYCEVCDIFGKNKSKYWQFEADIFKEFDKGNHKILTIKNQDINNIDKAFYAYIIQRNEKYDYYLIKQ